MTTPDTRSSGRSTTASKTDRPPETPATPVPPRGRGMHGQGTRHDKTAKKDLSGAESGPAFHRRDAAQQFPEASAPPPFHRRRAGHPGYFARRHRSVPAVAALLTLLAGILDILSALTPAMRSRAKDVNDVLPGALSHSATALTLVFGILLVLLARALLSAQAPGLAGDRLPAGRVDRLPRRQGPRRRRGDHRLAAAGHAVLYRRDFYAKGDPTTRWRAVWYGAALIGGSIVLGHDPAAAARPPDGRPAPALGPVRARAAWAGGLRRAAANSAPKGSTTWSPECSAGMGLLIALTIVYLALRPPEPRPMLTPDDETRMRALLDGPARWTRFARLLRPAPRQERRLVALGQGRDRVPGAVRGAARQRRSAR